MDQEPILDGFIIEIGGQNYEYIAADVYKLEEGEYRVELVWRSQCCDCGKLYEFGTPTTIPEGRMRRTCDQHTAPALRVVK